MTGPRLFRFAVNDWVPNNPVLPTVLDRNAVAYDLPDLAATFEGLFARNGWVPAWRGTMQERHHFHAAAHEVFWVTRESAIVMVGGPGGRKIPLDESDALFLPAGTGHCRLAGSQDLQIVAAYSPGANPAVHSSAATARELLMIAALPPRANDPVLGVDGPVARSAVRRAP